MIYPLESFLIKSRKAHGDKYDYSKVSYVRSDHKVIIICPKHGDFTQVPSSHWRGAGCKECGRITAGNNKKFTTAEFITKALEANGDIYDYSKVDYKNNKQKIIVTCKVHGDFYVLPHNHLHLCSGCQKCNGGTKHTQETVIQEFIKTHNNKYNYDKVIYVNSYTKITITCPKHGDFIQDPHSHRRGYGCKKCKDSKGEKLIYSVLTNNKIKFESQKTYDDCVNPKTNYKLKFDFFAPKYNLVIEYDGQQHFDASAFGGKTKNQSKKNFKKLKFNDSIKNDYCYKNNINLLRIPYTKIKEAEKIIAKRIKTLDFIKHERMLEEWHKK